MVIAVVSSETSYPFQLYVSLFVCDDWRFGDDGPADHQDGRYRCDPCPLCRHKFVLSVLAPPDALLTFALNRSRFVTHFAQ
jgi:hypothetical protein